MASADIEDQTSAAAGRRDAVLPTVFMLLPLPATGKGVSYGCASIARNLAKMAFVIELFTPYGNETSSGRYRMTQTLPFPLPQLPFRKVRNLVYRVLRSFAVARNEAAMRKAALRERATAIAYVWPEPSAPTLQALRGAGIPIVREMINSHVGSAKAILDAEYRQLGLPPGHLITDAAIKTELTTLSLSDYVFCSNPLSEKSVIDAGVPPAKVRSVSFGWDPARFVGEGRALSPIDGATFLYVGLICVRKGAHLILRYWAESGIRGRLVMVGTMEPAVEKVCAEYLRRDDVIIVNYTPSIGDYYRSADVFVFPTLEEGGPQVTYEAAGCGLAVDRLPDGRGARRRRINRPCGRSARRAGLDRGDARAR